MTCPGGCISGAGQPGCKVVPVPDSVRNARIRSLYGADRMRKIRNALDNGEVKTLYDTFLGNPMSPLSEAAAAHALLQPGIKKDIDS